MNRKILILASSSPRRRDFVKRMGFSFRVLSPDIDERRKKGESPVKMAMRLSREKARAVAHSLSQSSDRFVILSADTIVVAPGGKVLGKPRSRVEAVQMLRSLQGKVHAVITAYCLLEIHQSRKIREICRRIRTRVKIRSMDSGEISRYVAQGESMDKAGAYAAQGFGALHIEWVRGSYSNVIGLPVSDVLKDLRREFGIYER